MKLTAAKPDAASLWAASELLKDRPGCKVAHELLIQKARTMEMKNGTA